MTKFGMSRILMMENTWLRYQRTGHVSFGIWKHLKSYNPLQMNAEGLIAPGLLMTPKC